MNHHLLRTNRRLVTIMLSIVGVSAVLALGFTGGNVLLQALIMAVWFALLGVAWNLQAGFAGVLGLGNAAYVCIGAYTSIVLSNHGISPWLGMWVGVGLSVALGVTVAGISLRAGLRGITYALATFASAQILYFLLLEIPSLGGAAGVRLEDYGHSPAHFRFDDFRWYLVVVVAMLVLTTCFVGWINQHRLGTFFRAIRENERAAAMSGIPVMRYQLIAVALSAGITSVAGTFYAQFQFSASPAALLGLAMALNTVIYTVVGGTGYVFGPIIGAAVLVAVTEVTANWSSSSANFASDRMIMYGVVIVLIALFLPRGLLSLLDRFTDPPNVTHSTAPARSAGPSRDHDMSLQGSDLS